MDKNEIKKVLYKEKPVAKRVIVPWILNQKMINYIYRTLTSIGEIEFIIPIEEMGEKVFNDEEPAQLLIRWISGHFSGLARSNVPKRPEYQEPFDKPEYSKFQMIGLLEFLQNNYRNSELTSYGNLTFVHEDSESGEMSTSTEIVDAYLKSLEEENEEDN